MKCVCCCIARLKIQQASSHELITFLGGSAMNSPREITEAQGGSLPRSLPQSHHIASAN